MSIFSAVIFLLLTAPDNAMVWSIIKRFMLAISCTTRDPGLAKLSSPQKIDQFTYSIHLEQIDI